MAQMMANLSEREADAYMDARPKYPTEWFQKLSTKTWDKKRAWDVGTGNGQAALGMAYYYQRVIATDTNPSQLQRATKHPKITYVHTPSTMSNNDLVKLLGGEDSIDLIVAAQSLHYLDLKRFYAVVNRVLRKPGGVIAAWVYNDLVITPKIDIIMKRLVNSTIPYRTPPMKLAFNGYKTIEFPFKCSIGLGSEGNPKALTIPHKLSLNGFLGFLQSWQPILKAKEEGVELLTDCLIDEFKRAWGDQREVKQVVYKAYMIAGRPQVNFISNFFTSVIDKLEMIGDE